jgi:hypothetical protein
LAVIGHQVDLTGAFAIQEQRVAAGPTTTPQSKEQSVVATTTTLGREVSEAAQGLGSDVNSSEDPFDADYYLSESDCPTEPEEEYTSDTDEILAVRKLREIDTWRVAGRKRSYVDLVGSDADDDDEEQANKKKKARKERKERKTKKVKARTS